MPDPRPTDLHDAGESPTATGAASPSGEVAALRYEPGVDAAPQLVAKGRGVVADRIMELAREYDIPVRRDPTLVSILGALEVGAQVPPDLYGVIAEVLAWAYRTDKEAARTDAPRRAA